MYVLIFVYDLHFVFARIKAEKTVKKIKDGMTEQERNNSKEGVFRNK